MNQFMLFDGLWKSGRNAFLSASHVFAKSVVLIVREFASAMFQINTSRFKCLVLHN